MGLGGDDMHICPYNPEHVIHFLRMPRHLLKCRKNYPDVELAVCPFNACHEVPKPILQYHMDHCPERALLDRDIGMDSLGQKGFTDIPRSANIRHFGSDDENWDEVPNPYVPQVQEARRTTQRSRRRREEDCGLLRQPLQDGRVVRLATAGARSYLSEPEPVEHASHPPTLQRLHETDKISELTLRTSDNDDCYSPQHANTHSMNGHNSTLYQNDSASRLEMPHASVSANDSASRLEMPHASVCVPNSRPLGRGRASLFGNALTQLPKPGLRSCNTGPDDRSPPSSIPSSSSETPSAASVSSSKLYMYMQSLGRGRGVMVTKPGLSTGGMS